MTIQVTGILNDAGGNPAPNAQIKFITKEGYQSTLTSAFIEETTDENGAYNFTLAPAVHIFYIKYSDTYQKLGTVSINTETPSPLAIEDLLSQSEPPTDAEILQMLEILSEVRDIQTDVTTKSDQVTLDAAQVASDTDEVTTNAAQVSTDAAQVASDRTDVETLAAQVSADADQVETDRGVVETLATQVSTDAGSAADSEASASDDADRAEAAALTASNGVVDRGSWDASSGNFPTPTLTPEERTDWYRISVAGLMSDGVQPDVEVNVSDNLYWDRQNDVWYKIDNTDKVNSVNGKEGDVVLGSDDIADVYSKDEVLQITDPLGVRVSNLEDSVSALEEDTGWINAGSLIVNGWTEVNSASLPVQYRREGKRVTLRGLLSDANATSTVALTLPAGFRPTQSYYGAQANNRAVESALMQITSGGAVIFLQYATDTGTWHSLDCSFYVD